MWGRMGREPVARISLSKGFPALSGGVNHLVLKIDGAYRCLQMDHGALLCKLVRGGVKQPAGTADLTADPQGHAAAQKADVVVLVEHRDLLVGIVVQNGVDGGGAGVVGADNCDVHKKTSFHLAFRFLFLEGLLGQSLESSREITSLSLYRIPRRMSIALLLKFPGVSGKIQRNAKDLLFYESCKKGRPPKAKQPLFYLALYLTTKFTSLPGT